MTFHCTPGLEKLQFQLQIFNFWHQRFFSATDYIGNLDWSNSSLTKMRGSALNFHTSWTRACSICFYRGERTLNAFQDLYSAVNRLQVGSLFRNKRLEWVFLSVIQLKKSLLCLRRLSLWSLMVVLPLVSHNEHRRVVQAPLDMLSRGATPHAAAFVVSPEPNFSGKLCQLL